MKILILFSIVAIQTLYVKSEYVFTPNKGYFHTCNGKEIAPGAPFEGKGLTLKFEINDKGKNGIPSVTATTTFKTDVASPWPMRIIAEQKNGHGKWVKRMTEVVKDACDDEGDNEFGDIGHLVTGSKSCPIKAGDTTSIKDIDLILPTDIPLPASFLGEWRFVYQVQFMVDGKKVTDCVKLAGTLSKRT